MARWLFKTDPARFAWRDLVAAGRVCWNGTQNALALRHLRTVRRGDEVLVYHGGGERRIVGVARVVRGAYRDPDTRSPGDWVVDLVPREILARAVGRRELVALRALESWELVRLPRLCVLPVPDRAWRAILQLASGAAPRPPS